MDWRTQVLNRVIDECQRRLANLDAYDFEIVNFESELELLLEKKERELHGTPADERIYFSPAAQTLLGRGEAVKYFIGERNIVYAMDFEGNEQQLYATTTHQIEAQQMDRMLFQAFPALSPGLHSLLDHSDTIPALYGYDYFLCGSNIVLRGTQNVCEQVVGIINSHGVHVNARPLDKAWLIYEPTCESES